VKGIKKNREIRAKEEGKNETEDSKVKEELDKQM
jgi:hypothetical protein